MIETRRLENVIFIQFFQVALKLEIIIYLGMPKEFPISHNAFGLATIFVTSFKMFCS